MSGAAPHVALNCTAYDRLPSGARARAIGLTAGLLAEGARVTLYVAGDLSLREAVAAELGDALPQAAFVEVATPLDPAHPVLRAARSERWFRRHIDPSADLFVTDYYPVIERVRTALTVHDLRYIASPVDEPRHRAIWFRTSYARVAARAPALVVPSAAVGSEAVFHLDVDPARVRVVPNGIGRAWLAPGARAEKPSHLLWIGTPERRKQLTLLLRAYAIAASEAPLLPLVLVGRGGVPDALPPPGPDLAERGLVRALGVVSDDVLIDLARGAAALVHPSRYEGFGLPVLEALAVGTPVIAADIPAVREVAAGGARFVPAGDLGAWVRAIAEIGGTERCVVAPPAAAVRAARARTWRAAARTLLGVLD